METYSHSAYMSKSKQAVICVHTTNENDSFFLSSLFFFFLMINKVCDTYINFFNEYTYLIYN